MCHVEIYVDRIYFNKSYLFLKNTLPKDIPDVSCWTPIFPSPPQTARGALNSQELPQDVDAPTLCMQMGDDDMEEDNLQGT